MGLFLLRLATLGIFVSLFMIPTSFYVWEKEFAIGPKWLSFIITVPMMMELLFVPLVGHFVGGDKRKTIFFIGVCLIGIPITGFAAATQYIHLLILSAFVGIGVSLSLSTLSPLVISYSDQTQYGLQLGIVNSFVKGGSLLGLLTATYLSTLTLWGISGWKIAFFSAGLMLCLIGISGSLLSSINTKEHLSIRKNENIYRQLIKNKTVMTLLGMEGCQALVWGIFPFTLMLARLGGMSTRVLLYFCVLTVLSQATGHMIVGKLGDMAKRKISTGRLKIGAISCLFGLLFLLLLYQIMIVNPKNYWLILMSVILMGILGQGHNISALLADTLKTKEFGQGFSLFRIISITFTSLGYTLVGFLSENVFGYNLKGNEQYNVFALSISMQIVTVIGFMASFLLFFYSLRISPKT